MGALPAPGQADEDLSIKLQIERAHIEPMIQAFPRLAFVQEQLRFGNKVELTFN